MKMRSTAVKDIIAGEGVTGILFENGELIIWGSTLATRQDIVPLDYQGRIIKAELTPVNVVVLLEDNTVGVFGTEGNELHTVPTELTDRFYQGRGHRRFGPGRHGPWTTRASSMFGAAPCTASSMFPSLTARL